MFLLGIVKEIVSLIKWKKTREGRRIVGMQIITLKIAEIISFFFDIWYTRFSLKDDIISYKNGVLAFPECFVVIILYQIFGFLLIIFSYCISEGCGGPSHCGMGCGALVANKIEGKYFCI